MGRISRVGVFFFVCFLNSTLQSKDRDPVHGEGEVGFVVGSSARSTGPTFGKFCSQVLRMLSGKMLVLYYNVKLPAGTD